MNPALQSDDNPARNWEKTVNTSRDGHVIDALVYEFADMFERKRSEEGKLLYALTLTYTESKDFPISIQSANRNLERFYHRMLEYLADSSRHRRPWFRKIQPELHAFVDVPGSKPKHYRKSAVPTRDSTYHHHCIFVISDEHREKIEALRERTNEFWTKVTAHCRIRTYDLKPVGMTHEDIVSWTDYASVHARRCFGKNDWEQAYLPDTNCCLKPS